MRLQLLRATFTGLLAGILLAGGLQVASGASADGPRIVVDVKPHNTGYNVQNFVQNSPGQFAGTRVSRITGTMPTSYVGINAYLYKGSTLCRSTGVGYNQSGVRSYTRTTSSKCGAGNYRSQGIAYFYYPADGGYRQYVAPSSPNLYFA